MTKEESISFLKSIIDDYRTLKEPKYRHADPEKLQKDHEVLITIKGFHQNNQDYLNIVNAISQTLKKIERMRHPSDHRTISERGINKSIPPVKKKQMIDSPFEWTDKSGKSCFINNGHWGARNYMVMDIIGYFLLLKEGGDSLPKDSAPLFRDISSISTRESDYKIDQAHQSSLIDIVMSEQDVMRFEKHRYWIRMTDRDFRRFTSLDLSSNEIRDLLLETSRVEFKLVYPVRIWNGKMPRDHLFLFFYKKVENGNNLC